MGASAADDRSRCSRSEWSLLRSFSAIRRSLIDDTTPRQANNYRGENRNHHEMSLNDVPAAGQESQSKRERRGSALQDRSSSLRARRVTPPARHATKASPTSVGAGILQPRGQGLPLPPFARSDVAPRPPRAPPAAARLRRRPSAPLEAERARETATRPASERQRHREARRGPAVPAGAGFRMDYSLGETARCPSHMIVHPSARRAARAAASLKTHDFAFLRRSDGSYTYAIVAHRRAARSPEEEFMVFVMCGAGSTKIVGRRHWGSFVRLVAAEGTDPRLRGGTRGPAGPPCPPSPAGGDASADDIDGASAGGNGGGGARADSTGSANAGSHGNGSAEWNAAMAVLEGLDAATLKALLDAMAAAANASASNGTPSTRTTTAQGQSAATELELHVQVQERPVLCQEIAPPVLCQEIEDVDNCMPPDVIVFSSSMHNVDDCSVISSVSERAM